MTATRVEQSNALWAHYLRALAGTQEKQQVATNLREAAAEIDSLLAACKALMPEGWDDDDGHMDHMPGIKLARLAIAKAEGRL